MKIKKTQIIKKSFEASEKLFQKWCDQDAAGLKFQSTLETIQNIFAQYQKSE